MRTLHSIIITVGLTFIILFISFTCLNAAVPQTERDALVALYNATDGANWTHNTNWLSGDPCENSWFGVTCAGNSAVQTLDLSSNQLNGSLPTELGNLSSLTSLSLLSNQLSGSIPTELGNLSSLTRLSLQMNQLSGSIPSELENLSNLQHLYLLSNQLSGSIPTELGSLSSLQVFFLHSNHLSGSIPTELGNLSSLTSFHLYSNQFSGTIPSELGNLTSLSHLIFASNQLNGSIPSELLNLTNLLDNTQDFRWNAIYTDNDTLRTFLNNKQCGGSWENTQTIAPDNVVAVACPVTSTIDMSWDPILYTADSGGYEVFYGTTPGGPYTFYNITPNKLTTTMIVSGLTNNELYYFTVHAMTYPHSGNQNTVTSEASSEVSETAQSGPLPIIVTKEGDHVRFDWSTCGLLAFKVMYSTSPTGLTDLNDPLNDGFSPEYHSNALLEVDNFFYSLEEAGLKAYVPSFTFTL